MVPGLRSHNISSICAGNELSAAVSATGDLFVWGAVRVGFFRSSRYESMGGHSFLGQQRTGSLIACGENHILIVTTTGTPHAWGVNEYHRLGTISHGANVVGTPIRITLPHSRRVVRVAAGNMHSFAIDSIGDVNVRGQIGIGIGEGGYGKIIETPRRVSTMSKGSPILAGARVTDIACGEFHSVFLLDDGRVFACGAYDSGQLGLGRVASVNKMHNPRIRDSNAVPKEVKFPFPLCEPERIIGIEADSRRSMAWTESHLFAGGMGNVGELGLGPTVNEAFQPTLVDLAGWKPVQVSCGGQHTLALFTRN